MSAELGHQVHRFGFAEGELAEDLQQLSFGELAHGRASVFMASSDLGGVPDRSAAGRIAPSRSVPLGG